MGRRRKYVPTIEPNWLRETTFTFQEKRQALGGYKYVEQLLEAGEKCKISDETGWFIFTERVINLDNDKQWVNCIQLHGVKEERGCMRSFRPERIKKKYRVIKRRGPRKKKTEGVS